MLPDLGNFQIKIVLLGFLSLLSCSDRPELIGLELPEITEVTVAVELSGMTFSAGVSGDASLVTECGFLFGEVDGEMTDVPCQLEGKSFVGYVTDFEYETSCQVRAYVGNGRNVRYSGVYAFRTPVKPQVPEPGGPDGPVEPDNPGPGVPETPDGPVVPEPEDPVEPDRQEEIIVFADEQVRSACVEALDDNSDGEVSLREAAAVTDLSAIALKGKTISSFDEFRYFTSVRSVPYEYFKNSYLESIKLPSSLEVIGESSFAYCICLTEMEIPASVKKIEKFAFCYCSNLRRVTLPDTLGDIAEQAFRSCYALREINIPQSVTELSDWLFYQCRSLSSVSLPENLRYIRSGVFEDCDALIEVTVPSDVKVIGDNAFSDCESLERVFIKPLDPPVLGLTPFNDNHPDRIIYVPSSALEVYKERWTQYEASICALK